MRTNETPLPVILPLLTPGDRVRVTERGQTRELSVLGVYKQQGKRGEVFVLGSPGFAEVVRVRGNNLVVTDGFPLIIERIL